MSNEIKETFRFLSEKPSLKIAVSSGDVIEFSPYYITQDESVAAELRKIPNIYEVNSLQGASVNSLPGKMILRDADGRAKVGNPAEPDDIATKGYTDTGLATKAEAIHHHNKNDIDGLEGLDNLVKSVNSYLPDSAGNVQLPIDSVKTVNANLPDEYGNITIEKDDIGLDMVDNTPDVDKPISKATQAALAELGAVDVNTLQEDINVVKRKVQNGLYIKKDNAINIDTFLSQGGTVAFLHTAGDTSHGTMPAGASTGFYNVFNMGFANNADDRDRGANGQLLIMGTYIGAFTNSFLYYRPRMINSSSALVWGEWKKIILSGDVIPLSDGGTGARTAEAARETLGVLPIPHLDTSKVGGIFAGLKLPTQTDVYVHLPNGGSWLVQCVILEGGTPVPGLAVPLKFTILPGGSLVFEHSYYNTSMFVFAIRIA